MKPEVYLECVRPGYWIAILKGKSSPMLKPVPGNSYPATRWIWNTKQDAEHDLIALGFTVKYKGAQL